MSNSENSLKKDYSANTSSNLNRNNLQFFQRSIGNSSVGKILNSDFIQTELNLSFMAGTGIQFQSNTGAGNSALPQRLDQISERDRRQIQINTTPVTPGMLTTNMLRSWTGTTAEASGGGGTERIGVNGTIRFSPNIPQTPPNPTGLSQLEHNDFNIQRGLSSVAGWLTGRSNILSINNTVTLQLDLTPFGWLNTSYRFTYFDNQSGSTNQRIMLIEQLGTSAPVSNQTNNNGRQRTGPFSVKGTTFQLERGWSIAQFNILTQALNLIPPSALSRISGVNFVRIPTVANSTEAGHYDPNTNTISIMSNAFNENIRGFGSANEAMRIVIHEVGHAIDSAEYSTRLRSRASAQQLRNTTGLSGIRWRPDNEGVFESRDNLATSDYRRAVDSDRTGWGSGAGRVTLPNSITTYGDTNWEENFAEAFSHYITDEDTFCALRPATCSYFRITFPEPPPLPELTPGLRPGTDPVRPGPATLR